MNSCARSTASTRPSKSAPKTPPAFPKSRLSSTKSTSASSRVIRPKKPTPTASSTRRENITDWALEQFRAHYHDPSITKGDIFQYIYAVLHHPDYSERYAANLRRELPPIPIASSARSSFYSVIPSGAGSSNGRSHGVEGPRDCRHPAAAWKGVLCTKFVRQRS